MRSAFPLFVGMVIVLAGASLILEAVFKIHIPLLRIAFGLFFIVLGARIVFGPWPHLAAGQPHAAVMSEQRFAPGPAVGDRLKYDVVFGRAEVDLTGLSPLDHDVFVEVNAVFGDVLVMVDPTVALEVDSSAAFGMTRLPDRQTVAFGSAHYQGSARAGPRLELKLNAVFGNAEVREVANPRPMTDAPHLPAPLAGR